MLEESKNMMTELRSLRTGIKEDNISLYRMTHVASAAPSMRITQEHLKLLRLFQRDDKAQFSCKGQGQALAHILARGTSLLVLLPTGAGKSFLFFGPAIAQAGLAIVITPYRALLDSHLKTAEEHGLEAMKWENNLRVTQLTRLVFAAAEHVILPNFLSWCTRLHENGQLSRIYIDEVHEVLIAQSYRDIMRHLKVVVQLGAPVIGMTATMPPELEPDLRKELGLPTWYIIREKTQRPNLIYRNACYRDQRDMEYALGVHLRHYETQLQKGEGILVICRSISQVDRLGKLLGYPTYHSQTDGTDAAKWLRGDIPVILATTGLGTGVHHAACRVIIHCGLGYGVMGLCQERGRAGRDGKPAVCLLLHTVQNPPPPDNRDSPSPNIARYNGWDQLLRLVDGKDCERQIIFDWMDGPELGESCATADYHQCGVCETEYEDIIQEPGFQFDPEQTKLDPLHQVSKRKMYTKYDLVINQIPRTDMCAQDLVQSVTPQRAFQPMALSLMAQYGQPSVQSTQERTPKAPAAHSRLSSAGATLTARPVLKPARKQIPPSSPAPFQPSSPVHPAQETLCVSVLDSFMDADEGIEDVANTAFARLAVQDDDIQAMEVSDDIGDFSSPPAKRHRAESSKKQGALGNTQVRKKSGFVSGLVFSGPARLTTARAIERAKLPKPVGQLVIQDTRNARRRNLEAVARDSVQPGSISDQVFRIFHKLKGRCMICLIEKGLDQCSTHTVTKRGKVEAGYKLPNHPIGDVSLYEAKRSVRVPENKGICYVCLWPLHMHEGEERPRCAGSDIIYPLCWLLIRNEVYREEWTEKFNVQPDTLDGLMDWLVTVNRENGLLSVDGGRRAAFLNAHLLVLWFMIEYTQYIDPVEKPM
ncbi:hypothetical protein FRC07_010005 [Ceratobasidium sp. 392]|nr:hypothetical protein FRC07_010005 [Ceratobasidium sp. 392]